MNWIAVGALAEVVGVFFIFVSIIYLAIQIRQNTDQISQTVAMTELAAFERNIESGNNIRELLILNPDVTNLFLKGGESYEQLEPMEKFRFEMLLRNMLSSSQGAYIRQLTVRNNPQDIEATTKLVDSILSNPGVQECLERTTPDWRPEFKKFIAERLKVIKQKKAEKEAAV